MSVGSGVSVRVGDDVGSDVGPEVDLSVGVNACAALRRTSSALLLERVLWQSR